MRFLDIRPISGVVLDNFQACGVRRIKERSRYSTKILSDYMSLTTWLRLARLLPGTVLEFLIVSLRTELIV